MDGDSEVRMQEYDEIGQTYNATRRADPRIVDQMIKLLGLPQEAAILDVGAGTGNYSLEWAKHGYHVTALEPSLVMHQQGHSHPNLKWILGSAENMPFEDQSFDGIVSTLAVHHFSNVERSFREMTRAVRKGGSIVLFISDPRLCPKDSWLADYFEPIFQRSNQVYPKLNDLVDTMERVSDCMVHIHPFLLPPDMTDRFFMTGWRNPEWYLDPLFRQGVSPLANAPADMVEDCVQRLARDLDVGAWFEKYGEILTQTTYDGGYRFLVVHVQDY